MVFIPGNVWTRFTVCHVGEDVWYLCSTQSSVLFAFGASHIASADGKDSTGSVSDTLVLSVYGRKLRERTVKSRRLTVVRTYIDMFEK